MDNPGQGRHAPAAPQGAQAGKAPVKVIGIAAALAAFAVTLALMMYNPSSDPQTKSETAARDTSQQCQLLPRRFYVTGNAGSTVRFRAGGYLSPPYVLTATQQTVVFPQLRPALEPATEEIIIEGNATGVVLTSDRPGFRLDINSIVGVHNLTATWAPMRSC